MVIGADDTSGAVFEMVRGVDGTNADTDAKCTAASRARDDNRDMPGMYLTSIMLPSSVHVSSSTASSK